MKHNGNSMNFPLTESRVLGISTVVPSYRFKQDFAIEFVRNWLSKNGNSSKLSISRTTEVFQNAGVQTRYSVVPLEEMLSERSFREKNLLYIRYAKELGEKALEDVFEKCGVKPSEVDVFITVSCTGFMIPSLDSYLMNCFPFRNDVKRLPITELGCAGGVASLIIANDYVRSYPGLKVLILSLELCSLNFQVDDTSADHIISTALFGDGAAATIVTGGADSGLHIIKTANRFFPETLDFMGFDIEATGFHIFLSPQIPRFVRANLLLQIKSMLGELRFKIEEIDAWLFHPGGVRILEAIEEALNIDKEKLTESREILRSYGNLSSATIFFVIDSYLRKQEKVKGTNQFVGAVGPGFELDCILMEWK
jgi:alkylresorcinol/alkylpyrone synthase